MELTIVGTGLYAETMYYVRILGPNEYSETAEMRTSGEGIGSVVMPLAVEGEYEAYIAEVAETSFTATKTCSPPVVTVVNPTPTPPPTTTPPALANTGGGDTSPLLWAGALAMLVASGLMLQSMRARRRES
jgi:LPXTG-motif cell wall-anchored protein